MINYIESEDENRSHRSDINRMRRRQRHRSTKYVKCLSRILHVCIKQQPSKIWDYVHLKVKQHWGWDKKSVAYKKIVEQLH